MKATLLLMIFSIVFFFKSQGQRHEAGFKVSIPDASNRSIFDQNPNLHHIDISYRNNEAASIGLYAHDGNDGKFMEAFYTHFEGDCYVLRKKYPELNLPQAPKLDVWHFSKIEHLRDSSVRFSIKTTLKRDTLIHNFNYFIIQKGTYDFDSQAENSRIIIINKFRDSVTSIDTAYSLRPLLKRNLLQFEKKLTHSYKQWKPIAVVDSVLIITGVVERNGSFNKIQLQMGRPSVFSEKVLDFIAREANSWWPRKINAFTKVRQQTKIFVRLNPDDTITFSTL